MSQKLILTSGWPLEKLMVYSPQITSCLKKLRDKFPEDGTMESYAQDLLSGAVALWIMFDGEDFKGIVLTQVKTNEATGHRCVIVAGLAGEDGVDLSPNISSIEEWATDQGMDSIQPVGRIGWKKPLEKLGYKVDRVVYKKNLKGAA